MVRTVDFIDPPLKLGSVDPSAPQCAMAMGPGRNKAEAVTGAGPDRRRRDILDYRGVNFFLFPIAVDDGARNVLDNGPKASANRSPA